MVTYTLNRRAIVPLSIFLLVLLTLSLSATVKQEHLETAKEKVWTALPAPFRDWDGWKWGTKRPAVAEVTEVEVEGAVTTVEEEEVVLPPRPSATLPTTPLPSLNSRPASSKLTKLQLETLANWNTSLPLTRPQLLSLLPPSPQFLVKDSHISYGYNNIRYMFEATINLARITGRIPVLPETVWARGCAVEEEDCTKNALKFYSNRNQHEEELGSRWNEEGPVWQLPLSYFLDLPHLIHHLQTPVIALSDYLVYQNLSTTVKIHPSGHFYPENYVPDWQDERKLSIFENERFWNGSFVRTDKSPSSSDLGAPKEIIKELKEMLEQRGGGKLVHTLEEVRKILQAEDGEWDLPKGAAEARAMLKSWGVGEVFGFSEDMIMAKPPSHLTSFFTHLPTLPFAPLSPPYSSSETLYIPGALHDQRPPGALYFSTPSARQRFTHDVRGVRPPPWVWDLGRQLQNQMRRRTDGRRWVGVHMRRGDFVGINWAPERDPIKHFDVVLQKVKAARAVLRDRFPEEEWSLDTDPFYLATDEADPKLLQHYTSHSAVLLDILNPPSKPQPFAHPSYAFTDIQSLVEQVVLAHSDYFLGSKMSSTSGGVVVMREAMLAEAEREEGWGWDWSWSWLEGFKEEGQ
ncbi:hypothetical protein T439DRAFT_300919 [Meredithblackwellia eburnea MCA 4105]